MVLDLRSLFSESKKSLSITADIDLSDYSVGDVFPIAEPVKFSGELKNTAGVITLDGTAEFVYTAPCDRCAEPTSRAMTCEVSHIIVAELGNDDNDDFIVAENMQIDIDELIRTDVILSLPFLFLCRDDCKGICPGCKKLLNFESCICEKEVDPRLAGLDDFLN